MLHTRRIQWTEPLSYSLQAVLYELPELISAAGVWGPGESERAAAIADALHAFAPSEDKKSNAMVIPIARLFHDDAGPHVLYVAVTPQTQFEQQLREPPPEHRDASAARAEPPRRKEPAARPTPPAELAPAASAASVAAKAATAAEQERTPARGQNLHSLISEGLAGFAGMELESPAAAAPPPAAAAFTPAASVPAPGGLVPIESLLYSGRAALARAREIRAAQAAAAREPTPEELDELMDLMELATSA